MRIAAKILSLLSLLFVLCTAAYAVKPNAFDIYGHAYNFEADHGKWIVINYWADWCHACIEEIPELNKLATTIKDKPVVFFGVNYDGLPAKEQQSFAKRYDVNFTMLRNNPFGALVHKDQITSLPVTYVISPMGHVTELDGEQTVQDVMNIIG
jgi:thiol-disulfide isomerase/thioredoxin